MEVVLERERGKDGMTGGREERERGSAATTGGSSIRAGGEHLHEQRAIDRVRENTALPVGAETMHTHTHTQRSACEWVCACVYMCAGAHIRRGSADPNHHSFLPLYSPLLCTVSPPLVSSLSLSVSAFPLVLSPLFPSAPSLALSLSLLPRTTAHS